MAVDLPKRKRVKPMSQMNVVPYIDVMLVLLIIFMVTAPMLTMGEIEVPSAGAASRAPEQFVRVSVSVGNEIKVTDNTGATTPVTLSQLVEEVRAMQAGNENTAVIIAADKQIPYEQVVKILNTLNESGIKRVGLLVAQQ